MAGVSRRGLFHPADLALVVPEVRHRQVNVAVAVQVPRLDIGDPRHLLEEQLLDEGAAPLISQQYDRSDLLVVRHQNAHAGHQDRSRSPSPSASAAVTWEGAPISVPIGCSTKVRGAVWRIQRTSLA